MRIAACLCPLLLILSLLSCPLAAGAAAGQDRPGGSGARLSGEELERFLARIEKNLSDIKSLWTEFAQEKHLEIFTEVIQARGRCIFKYPDRVRFEITEPFKSVLLVKDCQVAKYEFLEGKWQKLETGQQQIILMIIDHITSWIRGQFREKPDVYDIAAQRSDPARIILTPKNEKFREHINAIELVLTREEKGLKQIIIREPGGDYTRLTFLSEQRNIEIPEEIFQGPEPASLTGR